jgi:hypothetical protein
MANAVSTTKPFSTTKDTARLSRNQRRKNKFYHEGHEEHEGRFFSHKGAKKKMNCHFDPFGRLRVHSGRNLSWIPRIRSG